MTLREKQSAFILCVAKLIIKAYELGYELTIGEAFRTADQQSLYFEGYTLLKIGSELKLAASAKKSKTMNSRHMQKLAIDLNLFINGEYRSDKEAYKELAKYWKGLHPDNVSGYDWGWDFNHFEMKP